VGSILKGKHMRNILIVVVLALAAPAHAGGKITGSVDAKPSKFLKDTIVYVKNVPNVKLSPQSVEIDQKGMEFVPHIVLLAVGDTVKFQNHDKVDHNVMSTDAHYDLGTWGGGQDREHVFKDEGVFAQVCKLHPEMLAYVFVGQNRFAATVDDKGNFTIDGLPAGTYELDAWNPKLKAAPQKVTVSADGTVTARFSLAR
jgi:plastocyanin